MTVIIRACCILLKSNIFVINGFSIPLTMYAHGLLYNMHKNRNFLIFKSTLTSSEVITDVKRSMEGEDKL